MNAAVIVAAGQGTRMGPGVDKLFLPVAGQPLIVHAWRCFDTAPCIELVVLVVRDGQQEAFRALGRQHGFGKPHRIAAGGPARQDSVWNGLRALPVGTDFVAIHDGARPCVTGAILDETLAAAAETGAAVTARRITDTVKESDEGTLIHRNLERTNLWAVQTPQVFRLDVILRALGEVRRRGVTVTDDTAACELVKQPVRLVEATAPNPKVTVPADVPYIEWLLRAGD